MTDQKITIHNKISAHYRELHVDGAFGGITPRGLINLSFFAERAPIPVSSDFSLNEEGTVGRLIENSHDSKNGILRHFEFGVYLDLNAAKGIVEFLTHKIVELERFNTTQNEQQDHGSNTL